MKQQSGFTLIELVVVIVIIGILAATAVPRFSGLTADANRAVAQGVLGALQSSAVIQYGQNQGSAVPFDSIMTQTAVDVQSGTTVNLTVDSTGPVAFGTTGTLQCNTGDSSVTVDYEGASASGTIPSGLCEN